MNGRGTENEMNVQKWDRGEFVCAGLSESKKKARYCGYKEMDVDI